ncbi:MAG: hypothetical protein WB819_18350, partial [Terriglobia bacterium]
VALPGAGATTSLAIDSAGDFFVVRSEKDERQRVSFEGFTLGSTFTLGNLPAACSAPETDPIPYLKGNTSEGQDDLLAALEDKCGAGSFSVSIPFTEGPPPTAEISFRGALSRTDEPPLSCAKASGAGSCSVATLEDGRAGKVEKLEAGTGAPIEPPLDEGGRPRALALDAEDNLFVGDAMFPYRLIEYDSEGHKVSQFGAGQVLGEPGSVLGGNALAIDGGEGRPPTVYVASSDSSDESVVQAFSLPEPGPVIESQRAEELLPPLPTAVTLAAALNPEGNATEYHFEYGTDTSYGHSTETVTLKAGGEADEGYEQRQVTAGLEGLIPETTYHFRLVATNHCNPAEAAEECTVEGPDTTFATRPTVGIEAQWASEVAARSATLRAEVDPFAATGKLWIEYGTAEALGSETAKADLPGSSGALPLATVFTGLEPATTYFYRFAASDKREVQEEGAVVTKTFFSYGPLQSFTTQRSGLGFGLPDNRAWEMVSPPKKYGGEIDTKPDGSGALQAAASGDALAYLSRGSIEAHPEGNRGLDESSVLARRGPGGAWSSVDI